MLNDDCNDRVVVTDPQGKRIVRQHGVTGRKGTTPGPLNTPDGFAGDCWRDWKGWTAQHRGAAKTSGGA